MKETARKNPEPIAHDRPKTAGKALTIEALEARIAPSGVVDKKVPQPPYPPGALYGLVRRDNLGR